MIRSPFQRINGQIELEQTNTTEPVRLLLTDIKPQGVCLFVSKFIDRGQKLKFTINEPMPLIMNGEVQWCTQYSLQTKILADKTFKYRIGVKFFLDSSKEKEEIENFCASLYKEEKKAA